MSLGISIREVSTATNPDWISLKAENLKIGVDRRPNVINLPGGSIYVLDLGTHSRKYTLTGIVDTEVDQVFITPVSGTIAVGDVMTGTGGWDASARPPRGSTPNAVVTAVAADNTYVMVSGLLSSEFFIHGETVNFVPSGAQATINRPLPSKRRLEQAARYWYSGGLPRLYVAESPSATELVWNVTIKGLSFNQDSGKEDRFNFTMDLILSSDST